MRTGKVKFTNATKKKRKKKESKQITIVTACDVCGKLLRRTCARTQGSLVASAGSVLSYRNGDRIRYFCSENCKEAYIEV